MKFAAKVSHVFLPNKRLVKNELDIFFCKVLFIDTKFMV